MAMNLKSPAWLLKLSMSIFCGRQFTVETNNLVVSSKIYCLIISNDNSDDNSCKMWRHLCCIYRIISQKTRQVAWFVSHCVTSSRREQYVRHLQKHLPIDVFGACGPHQCLRQTPPTPVTPLNRSTFDYYTPCDEMVATKYRFYLAFENSFCADYVTEKFFRFLHHDVVVVVLGAANYSQFVARGTYIDVRDYRSPRHLANYLATLSKREDMYADYLRRKRRVRCRGRGVNEDRERRLCGYLHANEGKRQVADLAVSTDARRVCSTPGEFYRNVDELITH